MQRPTECATVPIAPMVVIGLTGGIACGKSTVGRWMASRGVPLIDADKVSRELTLPGTDGYHEVLAAFGDRVLAPDGAIARKTLGELVFGDPEARARLNSIMHPRIAAESARQLAQRATEGHGFALYEAALIIETGSYKTFEGLVVVTAQPEVQLSRLVARDAKAVAADNATGELQGRARIASQWPMADKVARARWVIDNSGSIERLEARTRAVYTALVLAYGAPRRTGAA